MMVRTLLARCRMRQDDTDVDSLRSPFQSRRVQSPARRGDQVDRTDLARSDSRTTGDEFRALDQCFATGRCG